jgi:hypothetical protein
MRIPLALCGLVLWVLACACPPGIARYYPFADQICLEAPYSVPPSSFEESDLVGTWQARYEPGLDTLYIRDDGTFRQVYENHYARDYIFETPWSEWWLQRFGDGRVRIHLEGARYYLGGIAEGELDGFWPGFPTCTPGTIAERSTLPYPFVDPFTRERVQMPRELVLEVRVDSSGDILLHHMWDDPDAGFALSGCWREHFRRLGPCESEATCARYTYREGSP